MVAGSVRMVHAIIYSLALGYGITIGTALCGVIYPNATSTMTCDNSISSYYNMPFVAMPWNHPMTSPKVGDDVLAPG